MFKIGANCFGIETAYVKSVIKNLEWVNSGSFREFADGFVEYNGRKVFVVNLERKFLLKSDKNKCCQTEFIVVSLEGDEFVMPIDEIIDIFPVAEKDILPIPAFALRYMPKNFFQGVFAVDEKLVLILDVSKLLHDENF